MRMREAVLPLIEALKDPGVGGPGDPWLFEVTEALKKLAPLEKAAFTQLTQMVGDDEKDTRVAVKEVLTELGQSSVPALTEALSSKNALARGNAAMALEEIGAPCPSAVPILSKMLDDPEQSVRLSAAFAVLSVSPQSPEKEKAISFLLGVMEKEDIRLRKRAATLLGLLAGRRAVFQVEITAALAKALKDQDPDFRRTVVFALGNTHAERALSPLVEVLADPQTKGAANPSLRSIKIDRVGSKETLAALFDALSSRNLDPDGHTRLLDILMKKVTVERWPELIEALGSDD